MSSTSDISKQLFEIPPDVEFPLELSVTLKSKLQAALEQNFHLKRHVDYLEKEVLEFRKEKIGRQSQDAIKRCPTTVDGSEGPSIMASKLLQLSKKNRDMTAHMESMKTKMKQLMLENDKLKADLSTSSLECDGMSEVTSIHSSLNSTSVKKSEEETIASSQQLSQMTNKLMDYRRKCQTLQMELQNALRALSQEVGDGTTPQNVLHTTNSKSWKGRQQQIIALQQKIADLQLKLSSSTSNNEKLFLGQAGQLTSLGEGDMSEALEVHSQCNTLDITGSAVQLAPVNRTAIDKQDKKKSEQIRALSAQLETSQQDLQSRQLELKAARARVLTLETQARSCKSQVDILEAKLREKDHEAQVYWSDLSKLKQEISTLKDKDRRNRDDKLLELQEKTRALDRERAISSRLQEIVNEKHEMIQKLDGESMELRNKLGLCTKNISGGLDAIDRIKNLEAKLRQASDLLSKKDSERQKLLDAATQEVNRAETERRSAINAEKQASKVFAVLLGANKCIDSCLEAGQVTNRIVLQEVEHIKTLVRELRAGGELYCLSQAGKGPLAPKKLELKVNVLSSEVQVLRKHLQSLEEQKKEDLGKCNLNFDDGDTKRNLESYSRIPVLKERRSTPTS